MTFTDTTTTCFTKLVLVGSRNTDELALIGDVFPLQERQGAIGTFMGIAFLGQGLSMAIGGMTAYFVSWRGVFALYGLFSLAPTLMLVKAYRALPSTRNPHSRLLTPYVKLLAERRSLGTYVLVLLEGVFIVGGFSYLGAYIAQTYHFNYLFIGLIMTGFGLATVAGGRLSGKLAKSLGPRNLLTLGLLSAMIAELALAWSGQWLGSLIAAVALLGLGFIFTHSTLLTRATEFAQQARGAAMSLVAFCFMGGGGLGTALGGTLIAKWGLTDLFAAYGAALLLTCLLSFPLIGRTVIEEAKLAPQTVPR